MIFWHCAIICSDWDKTFCFIFALFCFAFVCIFFFFLNYNFFCGILMDLLWLKFVNLKLFCNSNTPRWSNKTFVKSHTHSEYSTITTIYFISPSILVNVWTFCLLLVQFLFSLLLPLLLLLQILFLDTTMHLCITEIAQSLHICIDSYVCIFKGLNEEEKIKWNNNLVFKTSERKKEAHFALHRTYTYVHTSHAYSFFFCFFLLLF